MLLDFPKCSARSFRQCEGFFPAESRGKRGLVCQTPELTPYSRRRLFCFFLCSSDYQIVRCLIGLVFPALPCKYTFGYCSIHCVIIAKILHLINIRFWTDLYQVFPFRVHACEWGKNRMMMR